MGIVRCPDCGGKVSDRVDYCPHCGAPMRDNLPTDKRPEQASGEQPRHSDPQPEVHGSCLKSFLVSFLFVMLAGGGAAAYYYFKYMAEPDEVVITNGLREAANRYDSLGEFYHGVAQVKQGNAIYYINTMGELVEPPSRENHGPHVPDETNLVRVEKGGRWGMVDRTTHDTVIKPIYSTLGNFYDGFALASLSYGDRSMPEYQCIQGYVDTHGNHTFLPSHFTRVSNAQVQAEKRAYIESLPKGVTARVLGLPPSTKNVTIRRDTTESWTLGFDNRGVLIHYSYSAPGQAPKRYGVTGGFIVSRTIDHDGVINTVRYERQRASDNRDAIIRIGAGGRERVGEVTYSPEDGTVTGFSFEQFPSLTSGDPTLSIDITRY